MFKGLDKKKLEAVESQFSMRDYCKGDVVLSPGDMDKIYILKKGRLEIYHLMEDGQKVILDILLPGSIFGDTGEKMLPSTFVEATTDVLVCSIDKDEFFRTVAKYPELSQKLLKMLFAKLLVDEQRIAALASNNVVDRVFHLFRVLSKRYGRQMGKTVEITEPLTHEKLAQMLGASRQTVTTVINGFQKQGLVTRKGKYYIIDTAAFSG